LEKSIFVAVIAGLPFVVGETTYYQIPVDKAEDKDLMFCHE
jgi:hypothetical protein